MHGSSLFAFSFLFSRQDIGIYPPQKFSREVSFFPSFFYIWEDCKYMASTAPPLFLVGSYI